MSQSSDNRQKMPKEKGAEQMQDAKKAPLIAEQKQKRIIVICAIIALVAIAVGAVVWLLTALQNNGEVDYLKDDLSKYVYISEQDYKNFSVDISIRTPDESDVAEAIMKLVAAERTLVGNGGYTPDGELSAGDTVYIFYRGYLLSENGEKKPFEGGCNFGDTKPYKLDLGSGAFIAGFEYGLVGKSVSAGGELVTSGSVKEGQTVYLSFERTGDDAIMTRYENLELTLGEEADAVMGEGFSAKLIGKQIGQDLGQITAELDGKQCAYYRTTVTCAKPDGEEPITVQAHFPHNYGVDELNGKSVYFDVYVKEYIDYDVPEFTDSFITDVLEVSADDLAKYEGDTLTEKYKASIRESLLDEYEQNRSELVDDAVWDHLMEKTEVKKLPSTAVDAKYRIYYSELEALYSYAGSSYSSMGEFVRAYYQLSASADWKTYLTEQAKVAVAQKLLFYYIIRHEDGWMPSADEYTELYDAAVNEHLERKLVEEGCYRENYTTDEAYNAAVSNWRRRVIVQYGESYFADIAYSEYGMENILKSVTVNLY